MTYVNDSWPKGVSADSEYNVRNRHPPDGRPEINA